MTALDVGQTVVCPNVLEFPLICRICLKGKEIGAMSLQPIHAYRDIHNASTHKQIDLTDKIDKCSDVNIGHNYHLLPNNICTKCYDLLLIAHYFKTLTTASDRILRNILENNSNMKLKKDEIEGVKSEIDLHYNDWDNNDSHQTVQDDSYSVINYCNETGMLLICDVCQKRFYNKSLLIDHMKLHTKRSTGNEEKYPKRNNLTYNSVENTKCYECSMCNSSFSYKEDLTEHMSSHKKSTNYKCYGCDAVFEVYSERTRHEKYNCPKMPPGNKYECRNCKTKCDNRYRFELHVKSNCTNKQTVIKTSELKPLLKCEHCAFTTTSKWNLNYHVLNCHTEDKPHVCEVCGKSYAIGWRLTKHYKQSHQPREKKFKCTHCSYATVDSSSLRVHNRRHTLEYRFSCDVCGASFKHSSGYHSHVRRYHREKEQQCEFCKRMFSLKASLKSHIASVHLGIKPFECKECGVAFSRKKSLKDHALRFHKTDISTDDKGKTNHVT